MVLPLLSPCPPPPPPFSHLSLSLSLLQSWDPNTVQLQQFPTKVHKTTTCWMFSFAETLHVFTDQKKNWRGWILYNKIMRLVPHNCIPLNLSDQCIKYRKYFLLYDPFANMLWWRGEGFLGHNLICLRTKWIKELPLKKTKIQRHWLLQ